MAQQKALEVTAHNIANANTPGYSRQVAHMTPTSALPYPGGNGMIGTGVTVDDISRIRDSFLDVQIRKETQTLGQWQSRSYFLGQVEQIFMEPSETGFNTVLSSFFDSWQELSLNPEGSPARAALIENSNAFTNAVRHTHEQLKSIRADITSHIQYKVDEVNILAEQIKDLNIQIVSLTAKNHTPSDLMDRRDLLIDQLAGIIEFDSVLGKNNAVNIYITGKPLVYENTAFKLTTASGGTDGGDDSWPLSPKIAWERDGKEVNMTNGELAGLIHTRDVSLRSYMEDFESMVWGVVNAVNTIHQEGMDLQGNQGKIFFTGNALEELRVNTDLIRNLDQIAAALPPAGYVDGDIVDPAPGDGRNAVRIAQLRLSKVNVNMDTTLKERITLDSAGTSTFESYYRGNIARLGVDTQESIRMRDNQSSLLDMLAQRKDSISGVSLDEEMANMVQFQLAYQASARVITTLDEIYDTLINRMLR
jgi:flagellar hook-associated protein 1 FlgK